MKTVKNWQFSYIFYTSLLLEFQRWTSTAGLNSKYYSLKGATIIKTLQFRFQVMNLTEVDGGNKYIHREFAADSYPDMDDWVRSLQEVHSCFFFFFFIFYFFTLFFYLFFLFLFFLFMYFFLLYSVDFKLSTFTEVFTILLSEFMKHLKSH